MQDSHEEIKNFMAKCFQIVPPENHDRLQEYLRSVITEILANGNQDQVHWDKMSLPPYLFVKHLPSPQEGITQSRAKRNKEMEFASKVYNQKGPKHTFSTEIVPPPSSGLPPPPPPTTHHHNQIQSNIVDYNSNDSLITSKPSRSVRHVAGRKIPELHGGPELEAFPKASQQKVDERRRRFANTTVPMHTDEYSFEPIAGRSTKLEKQYLRLTGPPNPDVVRPKEVLEKSYRLLVSKWKKEHNYSYACDQFKSIRQDLSVQHIKDQFTVKVYQTNALVCLEAWDMGEYNKCLTCLNELEDVYNIPISAEFKMFRMFYLLHTQRTSELSEYLRQLHAKSKRELAHGKIRFALDVVGAVLSKNRPHLFALYRLADEHQKHAMSGFLLRERLGTLAALTNSLRGTISFDQVRQYLALGSEEEARAFVAQYVKLDEEEDTGVNCQAIRTIISKAYTDACKVVDIKGQI